MNVNMVDIVQFVDDLWRFDVEIEVVGVVLDCRMLNVK